MKSPEQMGRLPKKLKEEPMENKEENERSVTTPEEAAEMTRQRRKDFGLGEARQLKPEESTEIEKSIEELLAELDKYDLESFSPKIQDEWYWVEQEAIAGKDREIAEANLKRLFKILQKETEKSGN